MEYEQTLKELEGIVETLEKGSLPLEESLALYEKGVALTKLCESYLESAQQRIELLSAESGEITTVREDELRENNEAEI